MSSQSLHAKELHSMIMRRVWYSYFISIGTHSFFWQGMAFGGAIVLVGELVFVSQIFSSFLATPIGDAPVWIWQLFFQAAMQGEFMLLCALGVVVMTVLSVSTRLVRARIPITSFSATEPQYVR